MSVGGGEVRESGWRCGNEGGNGRGSRASDAQVDTEVEALGHEEDHLHPNFLDVLLASVNGTRSGLEAELARRRGDGVEAELDLLPRLVGYGELVPHDLVERTGLLAQVEIDNLLGQLQHHTNPPPTCHEEHTFGCS